MVTKSLAVLATTFSLACGSVAEVPDAVPLDARVTDAPVADAPVADAPAADAPVPDAGVADAATLPDAWPAGTDRLYCLCGDEVTWRTICLAVSDCAATPEAAACEMICAGHGAPTKSRCFSSDISCEHGATPVRCVCADGTAATQCSDEPICSIAPSVCAGFCLPYADGVTDVLCPASGC